MSEIGIERISLEDISQEIIDEKLKKLAMDPFKFYFIIRDQECTIVNVSNKLSPCGDSNFTPKWFRIPPSKKSSDQIENEIREKMRKSTLRRNEILRKIVERSKLENEKIAKIRTKLDNYYRSIETEIQEKRKLAESRRNKIFQEKMIKIKSRIEYSETVRRKNKQILDNKSINLASSDMVRS